MIQIKAPDDYSGQLKLPSVFLAGSIEMGKAEDWQEKMARFFESYNMLVLNPRRDDWDSSWSQDIKNKKFREQVEWELEGMEQADAVAMYFSPKTKSPISLLEMGLWSRSDKLIVCCPEGYLRKGNVDVTCEKYDVPQVKSLEELAAMVIKKLNIKKNEGMSRLSVLLQ